ncbi:MAG: tetratricopeptide repeat protein, partial [Thermodesulfobacteriota bacterium]
INIEKFKEAKDNFKKALTILTGHKGAREGMALAYNNEASKKRNIDTALPLYKKALEYNPNNEVIRNNLAGAYNGKAVDILNSLSQYSYTIRRDIDTAIDLLEEGLGILNPAFKSLGKMGIMAATMIPDLNKVKGNEMLQTMLKNLQQAYEIRGKLTTRF